jgi:hypothetical protein
MAVNKTIYGGKNVHSNSFSDENTKSIIFFLVIKSSSNPEHCDGSSEIGTVHDNSKFSIHNSRHATLTDLLALQQVTIILKQNYSLCSILTKKNTLTKSVCFL